MHFLGDLRPTVEHVSRIISQIGEEARIVVVEPDKKAGKRIKYASAHDLRRVCASRLLDLGVSTETLRIILRHEDFKTTERHYGARRSAQAAALELEQKLSQPAQPTKSTNPVQLSQLTEEQMIKLRTLLNSI